MNPASRANSETALVRPEDKLTIVEFAEVFGLPPSAIIYAIEQKRKAIDKPFYTIDDLAKRWNCSRATVYNLLRESEYKLFNMTRAGRDKGKWNVPAAVVEKLEQSRMEPMPDSCYDVTHEGRAHRSTNRESETEAA